MPSSFKERNEMKKFENCLCKICGTDQSYNKICSKFQYN